MHTDLGSPIRSRTGQRQLVGAAAPTQVAIADRSKWQGLAPTRFFSEFAARMEAAAGGKLSGLGHIAH